MVLFAWIWPSDDADVRPGRKVELLAVCRDAVEERLKVDIDPEVFELPTVETRAGNGYVLSATVTIDGRLQAFSCAVDAADDALRVDGIRLLDR